MKKNTKKQKRKTIPRLDSGDPFISLEMFTSSTDASREGCPLPHDDQKQPEEPRAKEQDSSDLLLLIATLN